MNAFELLTLFTSLSFIFYGVLCFASKRMKAEFKRFGLAKLRALIGSLQIVGGLALLVGIFWPPLLCLASAGFMVMMSMAVGVRYKIKDGFKRSLHALGLAMLCAYLLAESVKRL